jgi:hypothetical protein
MWDAAAIFTIISAIADAVAVGRAVLMRATTRPLRFALTLHTFAEPLVVIHERRTIDQLLTTASVIALKAFLADTVALRGPVFAWTWLAFRIFALGHARPAHALIAFVANTAAT